MLRTWALGLSCIVITFICAALLTIEQKNGLLFDAQSHMQKSVRYLDMDIDRTFYGLKQTFRGLENVLNVYSQNNLQPSETEIKPILNTLVSEHLYMTSLSIVDSEGNVLFWTGPKERPNLRVTDYFSAHQFNRIYGLFIGRPFVADAEAGRWKFGVSKGLRNEAGDLTCVLIATIDLDFLQSLYQGMLLTPSSTLSISSLDGYIYVHVPDYGRFAGKRVEGIVPQLELGDKTKTFRYRSDADGKIKLAASRKLGNYPLVATITEAEESILAIWARNAWHTIFLAALISLVLLFMTMRVIRHQRQQQLIKEELSRQATTDSLTGLANRRHVLAQAEHEIKKARRSNTSISFIIMDLDYFKEVNDRYGHDVGDQVLIDTANILKKLCREADIVSRYGGEEFLLVLPNTDLEGALADSERIRAALERTVHSYQKHQFHVTASFGVSQWTRNEERYTEALRRADNALYRAKNQGRNSAHSQATASVTLISKGHQRKKLNRS